MPRAQGQMSDRRGYRPIWPWGLVPSADAGTEGVATGTESTGHGPAVRPLGKPTVAGESQPARPANPDEDLAGGGDVERDGVAGRGDQGRAVHNGGTAGHLVEPPVPAPPHLREVRQAVTDQGRLGASHPGRLDVGQGDVADSV